MTLGFVYMMKGPDFPHHLYLQFFSLFLLYMSYFWFSIYSVHCQGTSFVYSVFWSLSFVFCHWSVFLLVSITRTHPFSTWGKERYWFLFEGGYETEQMYALSYQGNCCITRGPGVTLLVTVILAAANLRCLCVSSVQWGLIGSHHFLLSFWEGWVEILFIP